MAIREIIGNTTATPSPRQEWDKTRIEVMTEDEYNALETKDETTIYIIKE